MLEMVWFFWSEQTFVNRIKYSIATMAIIALHTFYTRMFMLFQEKKRLSG